MSANPFTFGVAINEEKQAEILPEIWEALSRRADMVLGANKSKMFREAVAARSLQPLMADPDFNVIICVTQAMMNKLRLDAIREKKAASREQ